jgi:hypothetical protein
LGRSKRGRVLTVSMTWPAMPGNGSSIGTTMTTIRKARKRTPLGRQRVMEKWYGAGLGCTSLSFCVLRTDSTRNPPIGSLGMGSVARGYRKSCRVECSLFENSGSAHRTQHFSVYPYSLLGKRIVHIDSFLICAFYGNGARSGDLRLAKGLVASAPAGSVLKIHLAP